MGRSWAAVGGKKYIPPSPIFQELETPFPTPQPLNHSGSHFGVYLPFFDVFGIVQRFSTFFDVFRRFSTFLMFFDDFEVIFSCFSLPRSASQLVLTVYKAENPSVVVPMYRGLYMGGVEVGAQ